MLRTLNISNIVLIEKLNLEFGAGLNVFTGETGAGKSILLDALALALGARSDVGLVRHGCDMACVTAEFDSVPNSVRDILVENGISVDDDLILRRTLGIDGKSRAWINDEPVSIRILRAVGDALVEIHG
ncbi:MAG: AAA family ATPase, partial [Alphaproteobacteria bacterium]|nr:AAA family ATPase [Alphaproteobacteria bacterium]